MTKILLSGMMTIVVASVALAADVPSKRMKRTTRPFTKQLLRYATSPFNPSTPTDTVFVTDSGNGLDYECTYSDGSPLTITVDVDRVVGDVNPDGTLVNPQGLVTHGVVSKFAYLRMPAFDVDSFGLFEAEWDRVLFNGVDIGFPGSAYLSGANDVWKLNQFRVPIQLVRFGKRNAGGVPTPGHNTIEIQIDVNGGGWCTAIDWVELSFDALAPVIMIHGNNSTGKFFERTIEPGVFVPTEFVALFKQQMIPYDNTINMQTGSIADHGDKLATLIPDKAAEFGAKHVHIIAHSKGGLDVRDFLARTIPPNFAVLSLITLSTPHHGSAGADYQIDAESASALFSDNSTRTFLAQQVQPDAGTYDLRVSKVEAFNAANLPFLPDHFSVDGRTSAVAYRSFSADANIDDSADSKGPTIQIPEIDGIAIGLPGPMQIVYRMLGEVASTNLKTVNARFVGYSSVEELPTSSFQLNDFAVTVNSARLTGFTEVASLNDNHATISNFAVGLLALNEIRAVQPVH